MFLSNIVNVIVFNINAILHLWVGTYIIILTLFLVYSLSQFKPTQLHGNYKKCKSRERMYEFEINANNSSFVIYDN